MFNVGKIVNTHGIKGEVKVQRITDFEEWLENRIDLILEKEKGLSTKMEVDGHQIDKDIDLIQYKGYDNIIDVEHFQGIYLKILENQLTDLEENEFYYHELIGNAVYL